MERTPSKKIKLTKQILEFNHVSAIKKDANQWSFGRAKRFKHQKREHTPEFTDLPTTLSDRTCSFGLGSRSTMLNLKGKDSPSPGTYESPSIFGKHDQGASFKKKYTKNLVLREVIPGPGAYNPYSPIGKRAPKYTFREKFIEKTRCNTPPPNTYHPNFKLVEPDKFKLISFGIGQRPQIYGKIEEIPGPGTYEIPSCFSTNLTSRKSSPRIERRVRTPVN